MVPLSTTLLLVALLTVLAVLIATAITLTLARWFTEFGYDLFVTRYALRGSAPKQRSSILRALAELRRNR